MLPLTQSPARSGSISSGFNTPIRLPKKQTKHVAPDDNDDIRRGPAPSSRGNSTRYRVSTSAPATNQDAEICPDPPREHSNRAHRHVVRASRGRRARHAAAGGEVRHISIRRAPAAPSSIRRQTVRGLRSHVDSTPLSRRSRKTHRASGSCRTPESSSSCDETSRSSVSSSSGARSFSKSRSETPSTPSESDISFERQLDEGDDADVDDKVLDGSYGHNFSEAPARLGRHSAADGPGAPWNINSILMGDGYAIGNITLEEGRLYVSANSGSGPEY
ncbi:hypothetical protein FGB62_226g01 [Gracilaria domingensis]|nr:hypothetical protein FGB62_226g01 [Gracilaria domingensis]